MKQQFEEIVSDVCGDNWNSSDVSLDERDGGYGVAIAIAYLQGCRPRPRDLSDWIDTDVQNIEIPHRRLEVSGFFTKHSPLSKDRALRPNKNKNVNPDDTMRSIAWIAGIASGFCGKGLSREEIAKRR